mgnify:CR=1 FL=1
MMFSKVPVNNLDTWDPIKDDPVRPGLSFVWRARMGPIFYRGALEEPDAVVCTATLPGVPQDVRDVVNLKHAGQEETVVCAYTVWSYKPRAGRKIIFDLREWAIDNKYERLVTLSPQTDMAHKFHINNGAWLLRENKDTRNYEYDLQQLSFVF